MRARPLTALLVLPTAIALLLATSAGAVQPAQPVVVNAVPFAATPNIGNGHVEEITQVGNRVIVGGNFTSVQNAGSTIAVTRNRILAFDATTGALDTGFAPSFNDQVNALLPGPTPDTVYVGGQFTTLGGLAVPKLVLLSTATGTRVTSFAVGATNGNVGDVKRVGNRLYVGGSFTKVASTVHAGLVTLNATTGAVDPYANLQVATNHNYGQPGYQSTDAKAAVGVTKLDINPAGTRLVAIGNFKTVNDSAHDQVFMADISGATTATLANWQTNGYTDPCYRWAYDSWIRDVDFSPDGNYFVIVGTGGYPGYNGTRLCDAAARWETSATGSNLQPTWVDWTGGDTLLSVAVTGSAVYVGGHQRWLNNPYNSDRAGEGAVPRPGLAALDPANGLPLTWNPGRNPRGAGAYALFASSTGLYVGSDTQFIGNRRYRHERIAFFPLAGGAAPLAGGSGSLPGTVYQGGPPAGPSGGDTLQGRTYDGAVAGPVTPVAADGLAWSHVRGAFTVGGTLFYGYDDGTLHRRTFHNGALGADSLVDPYHDPAWMTVDSGSGTTYDGATVAFYAELPSVTGMFCTGGRVYYTLQGRDGLYSRSFDPDSGIVGGVEFAPVGAGFAGTAGVFLDEIHHVLYSVDAGTGTLRSQPWSVGDGRPGVGQPTRTASPVSTGDWRGRAVFIG